MQRSAMVVVMESFYLLDTGLLFTAREGETTMAPMARIVFSRISK